ncbi:MAG TPA: phosphatase PAP2 family protein [Thermoanaerobaculia bacterium]|nr:phosphatase PAP2 family protein [Thermoanaerobaculia bacterium]
MLDRRGRPARPTGAPDQRARRRRELLAVAALLAVAGALAALLAIAALDGEPRGFDRRVLLALRTPGDLADPVGPAWLESLARDVTALGGTGLLAFCTLAVAGFLLLERKPRAAGLILVSIFGGMLLASGLKGCFDRPRPDLVPHVTPVHTSSFPSSHAMVSTIAYLSLAALLARRRRGRALRRYLFGVAALLILAVGVSRVYLGVHWPTDVLAGWVVGAAWTIACWTIALRLLPRHDVAQDAGDGAEERACARSAADRSAGSGPAGG